MHGKLTSIDIDLIDFTNSKFFISYKRTYHNLKDTIKKAGILTPPFVFYSNRKYIIITGIGRLQSVKELGFKNVDCFVIDDNDGLEEKDIFLINFFENIFTRGLNLIEQSIALNKLQKYYSEEEIIKEFLPLMGYKPAPNLYHRILKFESLTEKAKQLLADEILNTNIVSEILQLTKADQEFLTDIIVRTKMTNSVQKEFVEGIFEIAERKECDVSEMLHSKEIIEALNDEEKSPQEKCSEIRKFIKTALFPNLSETEEKYDRLIKESGITASCKVIPPQYFEGDTFKFEITAKTETDLRRKSETLIQKIDKIKDIFEI